MSKTTTILVALLGLVAVVACVQVQGVTANLVARGTCNEDYTVYTVPAPRVAGQILGTPFPVRTVRFLVIIFLLKNL